MTVNDVFSILVTKGNLAVLAAGSEIGDLAPGQIGVFDQKTKKSIDGSTAVNEFFIAVGVDRDGDGTVEDIVASAGQFIQAAGLTDYAYRPYIAPKPMIVEVDGYTATCDTDYAIRLELRNEKIEKRQGFTQFSKTYSFRTPGCAVGSDTILIDNNYITKGFVEAMNADADDFAVAKAVTISPLTNATHGVSADLAAGDEISMADIDALIEWNADNAGSEKYTKIVITTEGLTKPTFHDINLGYFKSRQTSVGVSLVEGFANNGKTTTVQDVVFEQGSGYDLKQKEYQANGWRGKPGIHRASTVLGLATPGVEYFTDQSVKYNLVALTYNFKSKSGWLEYENDLATEIGIPQTDNTTRDSLLTVLDAITERMGLENNADNLPTVSAGSDAAITTAVATYTVNDATATDADGTIASIEWTQVGDEPSVATITDGDTLTPAFSDLDTVGTYTFKMTVIDNEGNEVTDTMDVVVSAP